MPPGRPPTGIGSPSRARVTGSILVTLSERLFATQTAPAATVKPEGPRPTSAGGPGRAVPRSIRRTLPVVALLTQTPPAPTARRSGEVWGAIRRLTTRPPRALIAVTPRPSS